MKYYFLALATLVTVCVGCQSAGVDRMASRSGSVHLSGPDETIARGNDHGQAHNFVNPPANLMLRPGPGVDGPGPGVLNPMGMASAGSFTGRTTQIKFVEPEGMSIGWQIAGGYAENQVSVPGRFSFRQGASYRLKLSQIPDREGLTLYPTLQVYPAHPQTEAYLAHSCVPVQITDEDLDQIQANNFVTKVIYLPDPQHQELAIAGVETLVSTRLDPGLDPVAEADRRGTILAVVRCGNMDMESPESTAMMQPDGTIQQASDIRRVDGEKGQIVAPLPISGMGAPGNSIPAAMMMGADRSAFGPTGLQPNSRTRGAVCPVVGNADYRRLRLNCPASTSGCRYGRTSRTQIAHDFSGTVRRSAHSGSCRSLRDRRPKNFRTQASEVPDASEEVVRYEETQPIFRQW